MLTSKEMTLFVLLALVSFLVTSDIIESQPHLPTNLPHPSQIPIQQPAYSRLLQSTSLNNKALSASISKIVTEGNAARKEKGRSPLSVNSSLQTIIKQWAVGIRPRMTLTKYMQLYGMQSSQTYTFAPIPLEYLSAVVLQNSPQITSPDYANIAIYSNSNDNQTYETIVVLQGGIEQLEKTFTKDDIIKAIKKIQSEANASNVTNPVNNSNSDNSTKPVSNVSAVVSEPPMTKQVDVNVVESKDAGNNTSTNININIQFTQQTNVQINNSTVHIGPVTVVQEAPKVVSQPIIQVITPSTPAAVTAPVVTPVPVPESPAKTQTAPTPITTPIVAPTVTPAPSVPNTITTPPQVQTPPTTQTEVAPAVAPQTVQPSQPQSQQTQPTTPTQPQQVSPPSPQLPKLNSPPPVPIVTKPIEQPKPVPIVATINTTLPRPTYTPYIPLTPFPRPNSYASAPLPLITLTTPSNFTSFDNIILSHNLPSTFVKNEIFPFRGSITIPNPNGIRVNVIFSRVSDQRRLAFSHQIPKNQNTFQILALLNVTGSYYLSIFVGQRGTTTYNQYTIIPSFFGQIVSRTPKPIKSAALVMKGNDLWLEWSFSDVAQPPITNIIFSQDNGPRLQFLLSNFEDSLQVPYSQFADFNEGITNVEISQAFSKSESAAARTSDYSAPYNLIFNATTHNFAQTTPENTFQPIPLRVSQGDNVVLSGPVESQLENKVILLSPSNQFICLYIDGNSSNLYVSAGSTANLNINLNETGVYILQVNSASGQAIINVPIYVGDIYPLLPDFMDLTPSTLDSEALNQPSNIDERRSLVQVMVNDIRKRFGASILYLDSKLSNLAQNYSSIQIQQNFISHVDKEGKTASQRAIAAGITENIAENIAVNQNLTLAQLLLQRSPAHLKTIVDPRWTRIGLGIAQNSNGQYYLTQEFSSRDMRLYPLTSSELSAIESQIVAMIMGKYPALSSENKQLSKDLDKYQQLSTQPDIMQYLSDLGYRNFSLAEVEVSYNSGNYMPQLSSGSSFKPSSSRSSQLGLSAIYNSGKLQILVAYH